MAGGFDSSLSLFEFWEATKGIRAFRDVSRIRARSGSSQNILGSATVPMVSNQFGSLSVDTIKPELLLLPSAKSLDDDMVAPLDSPSIDHFKCYKVRITEGTAAFPPETVSVADQFQTKMFDVIEPKLLCNPVDKNDDGIQNPADHLVCYKVEPVAGEPEHVPVSVFVNNQFGPLQLDTKSEMELCVPSEKEIASP